jgi:predicted DNA-binding transcriptional regulator YafY
MRSIRNKLLERKGGEDEAMLTRDLHDIRDVIRLFFIYGFFTKRDVVVRNGIKEITYDKYKKTIHNMIDNTKIQSYVNEKREKCVYIDADYVQDSDNPLFTIWQGKSVTANDMWYVFAITDTLAQSPEGLTAVEVAEELARYTSRGIEEQTVRNRLAELYRLGLVQAVHNGRRIGYVLDIRWLEDLPGESMAELDTALAFFQNVLPVGVLGHHLRRRLSLHLPSPERPAPIIFKHHHIDGTIDDEALLAILQAIHERRGIVFDLQQMQEGKIRFKQIPFVPIKLIADRWQGRRYIAGYDEEFARCWSFRLDKMFHVKLQGVCESFEARRIELERQLEHSWTVVVPEPGRPPELVAMTLAIDTGKESFVLDRLRAEGKWGTVTQTASDRFVYRIEVNSAEEMLPWIRTFTGRIVEFQCSNPSVATRLSNDWSLALQQYEDEGERRDEREDGRNGEAVSRNL